MFINQTRNVLEKLFVLFLDCAKLWPSDWCFIQRLRMLQADSSIVPCRQDARSGRNVFLLIKTDGLDSRYGCILNQRSSVDSQNIFL